ncbi:MAG: two-component sensor histidine kinase [Bacteroidetes bacterium]|nr:two-component sensor histidine kinase [Bacteroidota bacterium]
MKSDENMDLTEEIHKIRELLRQREPKVKEIIESTLAVAESLHDIEKTGDLLVSYSNYYSLIKRDLSKCLEYAERAKAYFDMNIPRRASYYYGNLGINYHFFFKLPEAQAAYLTAIQHMEKIEDKSEAESNMLATIYYNLYILFSFTDLAILDRSYLDRALALYRKNNHAPGIIFCYGAIINDLEKQGKVEEAMEYSQARLKLAEETGNTLQTGLSSSTTGMLYAKLGDRKSSIKYFARAHEILFGKDIVSFHASYYDERARAHLALGEYEDAIKSFHKALEQYQSIEAATLNLSKIYKLMAEAYEKAGKYAEAIAYERKHSQVLLDNFKVDKVLFMGVVQKDFEKEQQERETAMLKQKNEEIQLYVNQLEQSNEELKQFAHAASHDLREPVRMIVSYTELLEMSLKKQLNPEQQEFFTYLKEGGKRINEMISGILTFSKVHSHDELTSVDLNVTMQRVKENLKMAMAAKNVHIECDKLPVVKSNSILMIQLFQNLISNAIKYNQSSKPIVKITAVREGGFYQFTVADNGIGIEDKYRESVFDMFSRLHNREQYSGSGIGLAICKKIVERMGGSIWNSANQDNGSDFIFTLPASY